MSQYNGRTAVLVDQHPLWLDAVSLVVKDLGMTIVGTATSGREGLALVTEQRPDVLVTGIQMPAGDINPGGTPAAPRPGALIPRPPVAGSGQPLDAAVPVEPHALGGGDAR